MLLGTIITSFPRRRLDKEDGDLDIENKTDVLETMLRYLRSAKRHPIQDAYDLSELIISQCVGILHRSDVISDLDFLKIFGSQADRRVSLSKLDMHGVPLHAYHPIAL
jgi:hypothetical protein